MAESIYLIKLDSIGTQCFRRSGVGYGFDMRFLFNVKDQVVVGFLLLVLLNADKGNSPLMTTS